MIVESVKNPIYANADGTAINCDVKFDTLPDFVPFTATPTDPEEYGRQLYADLKAGVYGPISAYVPPPPQEYALISPNDKIYDNSYTPPLTLGYRVVAVSTVQNTPPAPLYWVACPNYVTPNGYYYTGSGFATLPAGA